LVLLNAVSKLTSILFPTNHVPHLTTPATLNLLEFVRSINIVIIIIIIIILIIIIYTKSTADHHLLVGSI